MDDGALKTLFLPFDTGDVETGGALARWLFLNATKPPVDSALGKDNLIAVQGSKPLFNGLKSAGISVSPDEPDGPFDGALILISRHRAETRHWLNAAITKVRPGGVIVVAGAKTDGIASIAKEIGDSHTIAGGVIEGSVSKHHAKAFWFRNSPSGLLALPSAATENVLVDGRFETAPGMFSADHIDPGSQLLVENLPTGMKGRIADFCAGWGYLSVEASKRAPGIKSIALYEAHNPSLQAARRNMQRLAPQVVAEFHWRDLVSEKVSGDYDTVIMNPPFHQGRAADASIGQAIIRNAHGALHRGGHLYLVANRNLPYESLLAGLFFKTATLAANNIYKVIQAIK